MHLNMEDAHSNSVQAQEQTQLNSGNMTSLISRNQSVEKSTAPLTKQLTPRMEDADRSSQHTGIQYPQDAAVTTANRNATNKLIETTQNHSRMESPDNFLRSDRASTKIRFDGNSSTMMLQERYPEELYNIINGVTQMQQTSEMNDSSMSYMFNRHGKILDKKPILQKILRNKNKNASLQLKQMQELAIRQMAGSGLKNNKPNQQSLRIIERNKREAQLRAEVARNKSQVVSEKQTALSQSIKPTKINNNSAFKVSSHFQKKVPQQKTDNGLKLEEDTKARRMYIQVVEDQDGSKRRESYAKLAVDESVTNFNQQHQQQQQKSSSTYHEQLSSTASQIFSKAQEFGVDQSKFSNKLNCLGNLLKNYKGLDNMKDEFSQMLYASSSNNFVSKTGSQLLDDKVRLNRNTKGQLNNSMHAHMLEMIQNYEIQARKEKTTLEVFDVQNSLNQVMDPLLNNENILLRNNSSDTFLLSDSPNHLLKQSSTASLFQSHHSPKKVKIENLINMKVQDYKVESMQKKRAIGQTFQTTRNFQDIIDKTINVQSKAKLEVIQPNLNKRKKSLQPNRSSKSLKRKKQNNMIISDQQAEMKSIARQMSNTLTHDRNSSHKYAGLMQSKSSLSKSSQESAGSHQKLKMDLSCVSFLKPHIINEKVYNLAHKGITTQELKKTDTLKTIEQHRRYKRFLGTYQLGRNQNSKFRTTASNFPQNYNTVISPSSTTALSNMGVANYGSSDYTQAMPNKLLGQTTAGLNKTMNSNSLKIKNSMMSSTTYSRKLANIESYKRQKQQDQYLSLLNAKNGSSDFYSVPEESYQNEHNEQQHNSQKSIFENDKRMQQVLRKYKLDNSTNLHQSFDGRHRNINKQHQLLNPNTTTTSGVNEIMNRHASQQKVSKGGENHVRQSRHHHYLPSLRSSTQTIFPQVQQQPHHILDLNQTMNEHSMQFQNHKDLVTTMKSDNQRDSNGSLINFEEMVIQTASRGNSSISPDSIQKLQQLSQGGFSPILKNGGIQVQGTRKIQGSKIKLDKSTTSKSPQTSRGLLKTQRHQQSFPDGIRDQIVVSQISVRETPKNRESQGTIEPSRWNLNETELQVKSSIGIVDEDDDAISNKIEQIDNMKTQDEEAPQGTTLQRVDIDSMYQTKSDFLQDKKVLRGLVKHDLKRNLKNNRRSNSHTKGMLKPSPIQVVPHKVVNVKNNQNQSDVSSKNSAGASPTGFHKRQPRYNDKNHRKYQQVPQTQFIGPSPPKQQQIQALRDSQIELYQQKLMVQANQVLESNRGSSHMNETLYNQYQNSQMPHDQKDLQDEQQQQNLKQSHQIQQSMVGGGILRSSVSSPRRATDYPHQSKQKAAAAQDQRNLTIMSQQQQQQMQQQMQQKIREQRLPFINQSMQSASEKSRFMKKLQNQTTMGIDSNMDVIEDLAISFKKSQNNQSKILSSRQQMALNVVNLSITNDAANSAKSNNWNNNKPQPANLTSFAGKEPQLPALQANGPTEMDKLGSVFILTKASPDDTTSTSMDPMLIAARQSKPMVITEGRLQKIRNHNLTSGAGGTIIRGGIPQNRSKLNIPLRQSKMTEKSAEEQQADETKRLEVPSGQQTSQMRKGSITTADINFSELVDTNRH